MSRRAAIAPLELEGVAAGSHLPATAAHYFADVLRMRPGERVELSDGTGRVLAGRLETDEGGWRLGEVRWVEAGGSAIPLVVLAGLLKPKRWTLLIEKAVEMGATRIVPLLTHHVAFVPQAAQRPALLERWRRLALEASKQCRRAAIPTIEEPTELAPALAARDERNRILGALEESPDWSEQAFELRAPTVVLVGPEGGLDAAEDALARAHYFVPVSLGAYPLRAETAATALLAMARDRLGLAAAEWSLRPPP